MTRIRRAALRQDPDVIVLGDITDGDTAATALKAAESGRLVIATMPTTDATSTLRHFVAMLPVEEREIGRLRLAEALRAVIAQQLLAICGFERRAGEHQRFAALLGIA